MMQHTLASRSTPPPGGRPTRIRYQIIAIIFLVTALNYADRATFSIAGGAATQELSLSDVQTGFILSAFAWAYTLAQIPGGALLDRFGTKRIYVVAIAGWSILTAAQGFVGWVAFLPAVTMLFWLRFLVGMMEAPSFHANARLVAAWFPSAERGTAAAIFNSAQYFSIVVFAPLMGWLTQHFGWRSVFWVMGAIGLAAATIVALFIHSPLRHPRIGDSELRHIEEGGALVRMEEEGRRGPPLAIRNLRLLLTNRMLLGIYLGHYSVNVLTVFFTTWFPIYLVRERGMDILHAGFAAAVPALFGFAGGLAGGIVSDRILKRTRSIDRARKLPMVIGMVLALLLIACVWVDVEWMIVALMAVAFFGKGMGSIGWAVMSDVAPDGIAGLAGGVLNMFSNVAGIVVPIVIGYLVATTGSFSLSLVFVALHGLLAIFGYVVVAGPLHRLVAPARDADPLTL